MKIGNETDHNPRWRYDCDRCKFHWCCGPCCACALTELPNPPKKRAKEVLAALNKWRRSRGWKPVRSIGE